MEDAHAAVLDLKAEDNSKSQRTDPEKRLAYFGVYDGHGGEKVAQFAGENIHNIVAKQEAFSKGDIEQALKDGFLATDRAILNGMLYILPFCNESELNRADARYEDEVSGCTASVGVISKDKIWVVRRPDNPLFASMLTHLGQCWRLANGPWRQGKSEASVFRSQATERRYSHFESDFLVMI